MMSELGEYIRAQRTSKKMSVRKLAEKAGISHTEVKRIEDGLRRQTSPQVLRSIASALSIPYEHLMSAAGYIDNIGEDFGTATAGIEAVDDLNPEEVEQVNKFIAFLKSQRS